MSQKELNGLSRRQNNTLTIISLITIIVSYAGLRSLDPFDLIPDDNTRLFSSMFEIIYLVIGIGIGYMPIGIISLIKRKLI